VHERVTAALAAVPPRHLVYVSCNPATLARDVARLPGFRVESVTAFDMFPQTAHVETVCELVPEAA
jgi:23S rRNA (uracil1939-C5)-methyltransferase